MRRRVDAELVRRGIVPSRTEAVRAVEAGKVHAAGRPIMKASTLVGSDESLHVSEGGRRFASRGGEKLDAALERFGVSVEGRDCLDAGASSGGFTDCLLSRGASRVVAVDVGYGQLDWRLRRDPRVTVLERTNVRNLQPEQLPFRPELVVADVSFISLRLILPSLAQVAAESVELVVLVKPQFEVGPKRVGRGGVVRDEEAWRDSIAAVAEAGRGLGLVPRQVMASPIPGPAGNVEFLLHLDRSANDATSQEALDVDAALREGLALRGGP